MANKKTSRHAKAKGRKEPVTAFRGREKTKTSFERKPARERHDFASQTYELIDVPVPNPKDRTPPSRTARIGRRSA